MKTLFVCDDDRGLAQTDSLSGSVAASGVGCPELLPEMH